MHHASVNVNHERVIITLIRGNAVSHPNAEGIYSFCTGLLLAAVLTLVGLKLVTA